MDLLEKFGKKKRKKEKNHAHKPIKAIYGTLAPSTLIILLLLLLLLEMLKF
jgi:hypothetical protein